MDRKQKYDAGETPTRFYYVASTYLVRFTFTRRLDWMRHSLEVRGGI